MYLKDCIKLSNKLQSQPFQTITGTVERQSAHFYRVTVTEADLRAGVIITCTSAGNDKFKVRGIECLWLSRQVNVGKFPSNGSFLCHVATGSIWPTPLHPLSLSQVVFFDNDGHVTMVEESQKKKRQSEANLYVVPYGR